VQRSRRKLASAVVAALLGLAAACSGGPHPKAVSSGSTLSTTTTAVRVTPAQSSTTTTAAPVSPSGSSTTTPEPLLGLPGARFEGVGFGQPRPTRVFLGGDPTGNISQITWRTWGGSQATGTGTSWYVALNRATDAGSAQLATVVAFNLGTCDGVRAYQAVEWYFPQHGGYFDPDEYMNACTGSFSPNYAGMR
jgi:hypothetical protein